MKDFLVFILLAIFILTIAVSINALIVLALCWIFGIDFSWKLVILFILIMGVLRKIFSFFKKSA